MEQDSGRSPSGRAAGQGPQPPAASSQSSIPGAEYPPDCPSWSTVTLCGKCRKCTRKLAAMKAKAAPHTALIAEQSEQRCRRCDRIERYCKSDGQSHGGHSFSPRLTCESCIHMGSRYWGSDDRPLHHCRKSSERRAANFKSCGNFADDFMNEFRRFYDAGPWQSAENCTFFEPRIAQGIEAGTDETAQQAQPEGRKPGPEGAP